MPIGFLVDNEGPPASLDEMARDNAGDSALIEKLRRMKVGDVIHVGGGAAAGAEIKAVSMSAPTAEALAHAIHAARSGAVRAFGINGFKATEIVQRHGGSPFYSGGMDWSTDKWRTGLHAVFGSLKDAQAAESELSAAGANILKSAGPAESGAPGKFTVKARWTE